jgi:uncharacterized damage-inducible protein DinB
MRPTLHWSSTFVLFLGLTTAAVAQAVTQGNPSPQAPVAAPSSGVRAEFLNELKTQEEKFVQLAEAMPADKYTWRPAEGVRSVSEVFLHVAAANYNLPKVIGFPPPPGFKVQGFDKSTTDKSKVISTLKDSFFHMRQAVLNMPDADVEKQVDWFGAKNTYRGILLFIIRHNAEHLGQAIAYARINGVVPPWTAEQQTQQKKQADKPKQ